MAVSNGVRRQAENRSSGASILKGRVSLAPQAKNANASDFEEKKRGKHPAFGASIMTHNGHGQELSKLMILIGL